MAEIEALIGLENEDINIDLGLKEYDRIRRITKRVRRKITELMVFSPCSFLTLTFTDEVLNSTTEETRRRYVARFLKSISENYVGNIDYGSKNDREHYHAIVEGQNLDLSGWTYGFTLSLNVGYDNIITDSARLSKYINKLSNHATKKSTKGKKIIYSRQM